MRTGRSGGPALGAAASRVIAVLTAGLAVAAAGCSSGSGSAPAADPASPAAAPAATKAPAPDPFGASQPPVPHRFSLVPATGAYLGAYVQPAEYTQQAQISAVQQFQNQLGHPLAIVHTYHQWGKPFPGEADTYFADHNKILLVTWGGLPDTKAIIAGRDNAMIRQTALGLKALHHPVMLEFRHEMDRPNLQKYMHGPADYIRAWDHIRAIFTKAGASNVSWVWCPTSQGFALGRSQPYYPGDHEVDWICSDVYATSVHQSFSQAAAPFLAWAAGHHKPIIIGEFGVLGYDPAAWPAWLAAAGRLPDADPQVKAMAYFDANGVDSTHHPFQFWLATHPAALTTFGHLLAEPLYHAVSPGVP